MVITVNERPPPARLPPLFDHRRGQVQPQPQPAHVFPSDTISLVQHEEAKTSPTTGAVIVNHSAEPHEIQPAPLPPSPSPEVVEGGTADEKADGGLPPSLTRRPSVTKRFKMAATKVIVNRM